MGSYPGKDGRRPAPEFLKPLPRPEPAPHNHIRLAQDVLIKAFNLDNGRPPELSPGRIGC